MIMATTSAPRDNQARFMASGKVEKWKKWKSKWRSTSSFSQQLGYQDGWMYGGLTREVGDLMTAARAGSNNHCAFGFVAHSGEELAFANRARDVVVLTGVAERPRHAATARVEIDDGRVRDRREQRLRWRRERHRLLMTMPVEQD